jgi:hypothetical protein
MAAIVPVHDRVRGMHGDPVIEHPATEAAGLAKH